MGKRSRRRGQVDALSAPETEYESPGGDVLVLRGAMTPATRRQYAAALGGSPLSREDAWQRAAEFLFERLAVRWEIAGAEPIVRQKELLGRYRFASQDERRWIRAALREHLGEHFPELDPP
jgi:hypothetical protein